MGLTGKQYSARAVNAARFFANAAVARLYAVLRLLDARFLVALVSVGGILAWTLPFGPVTVALFCIACAIALTAAKFLRDGRGLLLTYVFFTLMWMVSQSALFLWEHPGALRPALETGLFLGVRLFALLGLALAVPLCVTPLVLGRTLVWYLGWLTGTEKFICNRVLRGKAKPFFAEGVWRAALALSLMMVFFPRVLRAAKSLRQNLGLRAPGMRAHKRAALLGLAVLRICGVQAWDMTLAIASRNVYRPEPWQWQGK